MAPVYITIVLVVIGFAAMVYTAYTHPKGDQ